MKQLSFFKLFLASIFLFSFYSGFSQLTSDAGPDQYLCTGDSVMLQGIAYGGSGPTYTFQWTPTTGLSNPNIANPMASPSSNTVYTLTSSNNGQTSAPDNVSVTVFPAPNITTSAGPNQEICLGDSVQLFGNYSGDSLSFFGFQWSPNMGIDDFRNQNPMVSPAQTTVYYLNAVNSFGCPGISDSVTVTLAATPIAEAGPNLTVCDGDSVLLLGSYSYTTTMAGNPANIVYNWSPGFSVSDSTIASPWTLPSATSWYHLEVSHMTCKTEDSVLITVIPALAPIISQNGNDLTAISNGFAPSFQWYWNGSLIQGATNQTYSLSDAGCYQVAISEGGCTELSDTLCTMVGITEKDVSNNWNAYPNPFDGQIRLDFRGAGNIEVDIVLQDIMGKVVWNGGKHAISNSSHQLYLEPKKLPTGLYFLVLKSEAGIKTIPLRSK